MTLEKLLKLLRGSILNDRSDRTSGSADYLWDDETLVEFINEAQRRFAVKSFILRDATSDEATKVTLKAGVNTYSLNPAVLSVMSAKRVVQDADLIRVGHTLFSAYQAPTEHWVDPASFQSPRAPGPTIAYSTDEAVNDINGDSFDQITLRVWPTPAAAQDGDVLRLRVVRKPLQELSADALGVQLELPRDHQIEMLDWAAYLALRIVDDDAGSPARAREFAASFEDHVTKARNLAMRKMFAPTGWGFGRGGFSWGT